MLCVHKWSFCKRIKVSFDVKENRANKDIVIWTAYVFFNNACVQRRLKWTGK